MFRLGAVDLIPIHPLTANISLEECGHLAHNIATDILAKVNFNTIENKRVLAWKSAIFGGFYG